MVLEMQNWKLANQFKLKVFSMFLRARRREGRLREIRDLDHNTKFVTAMV